MDFLATKSKSQQIAETIKEQIKNSKLLPGERLNSIRTLAEKFSVGRQIVLSAFDILRSEGLVFTHVGRGTFVSGGNAGDLSNRNYKIGFFSNKSRIDLFFNRNLFLGASERASEIGLTMLLAPDDENITLWVKKKQIDGLLVSGKVNLALIKKLKKLNIPFIVLGNYDLPIEVNVIEACDNIAVNEVIVLAYNKFKFKSIGAILGFSRLRSARDLKLAIKSGLKEFSVECKPENFMYSETEDAYREAKIILERDNAPNAVFVTAQAFPGMARYLFSNIANKSFKRPKIITVMMDKFNIMYPELIDIVIYSSAREIGNLGVDKIIKLLDGKINHVNCQGQQPEFEFLS